MLRVQIGDIVEIEGIDVPSLNSKHIVIRESDPKKFDNSILVLPLDREVVINILVDNGKYNFVSAFCDAICGIDDAIIETLLNPVRILDGHITNIVSTSIDDIADEYIACLSDPLRNSLRKERAALQDRRDLTTNTMCTLIEQIYIDLDEATTKLGLEADKKAGELRKASSDQIARIDAKLIGLTRKIDEEIV